MAGRERVRACVVLRGLVNGIVPMPSPVAGEKEKGEGEEKVCVRGS